MTINQKSHQVPSSLAEHHAAHPPGESDKVAVFPLSLRLRLVILLHIREGEESLDVILVFLALPDPARRLQIRENRVGL